MMETSTGPARRHGLRRWARDRGGPAAGPRKPLPRWRFWLRVALASAALLAPLAVWGVAWYREAPKIEPPFERIVGPGAGPVKAFALEDLDGVEHTLKEWADRPAIVLLAIAPDCPATRNALPEMARLAERFAPRGVLFFGVDPGPRRDLAEQQAAWRRAFDGREPPFPILRDPERIAIEQAGARATPEAIVLLPDGQVVYHGRIGARSGPKRNANWGASPRPRELESALGSLLANELPAVAFAPVDDGTPLPAPRSESEDGPAHAGWDAPVTFNRDVAPILWRGCARCHRRGEVGPFPLLTYRDAAKRADFVREVVESGQMPPWRAHPGAGAFLDAGQLSSHEIAVLARWTETGRLEGDPADLPAAPRFVEGWELGQPDLVLAMPEPMELPASGPDLYRAFALPLPVDHDLAIRGIEFRPGNRRAVHHARIHLDESGDARRRDRAEPGPGFNGWFRKTVFELPYPGLGGWTPGLTARFAPEGAGRVVPRGSDIVLQIHYHPSGKAETDRSSVGLYFARGPLTRRMTGLTLSTNRIDIPPGAKRHRIIQAARIKADVHLYSAVPHAHYLCREFRLAATLPDGTCQPLLWIDDWNMDWQDQYRFARPVRLPKGTIVTLAAYFDNSTDNPRNPNKPPRWVHYGGGSADEMCACHLEILPDDPSGYDAYPNKSPFGL